MPVQDDRDPVDELAEEFVDRLRRGEHPSVSDYAAAHPSHAAQLRELLPAVAQMEHLKRFRRAAALGDGPPLPDRFGDFRIVRELGRGGMGVVFEAVQESLGRPVALKVLASHSQFDGVRRERFIREAHAAARLHHTNIVPVFGVGEHEGVLPYYVMQLIRGQGLNALAQRWRRESGRAEGSDPTPAGSTIPIRKNARPARAPIPVEPENVPKYGNWRFVAEVGLQAAEALHYAHKQGVLHRDIKPGNLLLDSSNRVWVTDFGLAKVIDLNGITASGDILGTLQYVAPECLTGDSDPRSDVYGVGATLYELLTLIPPYPADNPARMLKQVADTDPIPLRQLNPSIPLDLETIVLKAMAREPDRRYVSSRELARDLQAFLEDRPIKARRQTWSSRMWRWCRRNPAIAILSPTVVAAILLAAVFGWVGYVRTHHALQAEADRLRDAEKARREADAARTAAETASAKLDANLKLSLATFESVFDAAAGGRQGFGVLGIYRPERMGGAPGGFGGRGPEGGPRGGGGPEGGPNGPGGGPTADASAKAAMLEAVLAFYDKFAEQNSTNDQLQLEAAKAHRRVGEARLWLGQSAKATLSFNRAMGLLKTLQANNAVNEKSCGLELVQLYLCAPPGGPGWDEESLQWSLDFTRKFEADSPPFTLGLVFLKLGSMRERSGNVQDAEAAYREAMVHLAPDPNASDTRPPPIVTDLAWCRYSLAVLLTNSRRWEEARSLAIESIDELNGVPERSGRGSQPQLEVKALTYDQLSVVCDWQGDERDAREYARRAQEIKRELNSGRPGGGPPGGPKGPPPKKD